MEPMEPVDFYGSPGLCLSASGVTSSRLSSNDFHARSSTTTELILFSRDRGRFPPRSGSERAEELPDLCLADALLGRRSRLSPPYGARINLWKIVLSLICRLSFARAPGGVQAGGSPRSAEQLHFPACLVGPPVFLCPRIVATVIPPRRGLCFLQSCFGMSQCHAFESHLHRTDRPTPAASPWIAAFLIHQYIIRSSVHLTCKCIPSP